MADRKWDQAPSGRLTLELRNLGGYFWDREVPMRCWRDRKQTRLESLLPEVVITLRPMAVRAREFQLAREQEAARKAELERQRELRRQRRKSAETLGACFDEMAAKHDQVLRLERLLVRC